MDYTIRIRQIRQGKGMTQTDVAKLLGTTQQHYARYENKASDIPANRIIELCHIFNVSADYLLGLKDEE